jgi:2-phospho-L-lactate guanylyltransferase
VRSIVIPFRAGGKSRLPAGIRRRVALAMLEDVLEAAVAAAPTTVVTSDPEGRTVAGRLGAQVIADPGGGQGPAVAAALQRADPWPVLIVNADLPRVRPVHLDLLARPAEAGAAALVEARDGTTNALALPFPAAFAPLYGAGSAARFRAHLRTLGLPVDEPELPALADDVDTLADLERIAPLAGPRTHSLLPVAARG